MKKGFIVVGLGYGDEGKGATVDYLCSQLNPRFVCRYSGGHQSGHRVVVGGKSHVFSQYGSGAIAGIPTVLGPDFIIEPRAMAEEKKALEEIVANTEIEIDPRCPVTTCYHRALNRLMLLATQRNNSCGLGVGLTRETYNLGIGIEHADIESSRSYSIVHEKTRRLRSYLLSKLPAFDWSQDRFQEEMDLLNKDPEEVASGIVGIFRSIIKPTLVSLDAVLNKNPSETIVFEGSQGVLLDETYGVSGFNTWSTVTPRNAFEIAQKHLAKCKVIGVTRTYATRHGEGFLYGPEMKINNYEPSNKDDGWQGKFRTSKHDESHLRRAIKIAKPDYLAVNHLDQYNVMPAAWDGSPPVAIEGFGPDRSDRKFVNGLIGGE